MEVIRNRIKTDPVSFESNTSPYFDSVLQSLKRPRWDCVRLAAICAASSNLPEPDALRENFSTEELHVVRRGNRASRSCRCQAATAVNGLFDLLGIGETDPRPTGGWSLPTRAPPC